MIWNHRINEHIQDNHIIGYMALKRGLYHDYFCNDNATETQIISALSDWYSKKVSTIITRSKFSKLITHLNYRNIDIVGIAAFLPPPIEHNIIDENAQNSQQESTENDSLKHDEVPLS